MNCFVLAWTLLAGVVSVCHWLNQLTLICRQLADDRRSYCAMIVIHYFLANSIDDALSQVTARYDLRVYNLRRNDKAYSGSWQ